MGTTRFTKIVTAKRLGVSNLMLSIAEQEARENGSQPRPVQLAGVEQAAADQLRAFESYDSYNKDIERALASRDAATGRFAVPLPDQALVDYRPDDNDAFIKNSLLGAETFLRTGAGNEEQFDDLNRTIGIFPKENVQATITIQVGSTGSQPPLAVTNQFILASCNEASQEKYQIFQTFDEDLIYFFDRNPHIYTYGGVLFNADNVSESANFQWRNRFQRLYETTLRGTRCVERGARAILTYEDVTRQGYLLNFQMSEDASNPLNIPFSFLFYVTREDNNVEDSTLFPIETAAEERSMLQTLQERLRSIRTQRRNADQARAAGFTTSSGVSGELAERNVLLYPGETV